MSELFFPHQEASEIQVTKRFLHLTSQQHVFQI